MNRMLAALLVLRAWDLSLCIRMNRAGRNRALLAFFRAVSWLGNDIFWFGLMLAMLLHDPVSAALPVVHMASAGLIATLTYKLLKQGTLRPRPYQVHQHIAAGAQPLDQFSFPSGHTLHAVTFSMTACAYFPALVPLLVPFTLLVAVSRMVLGLHYPSDVLAGAALGLAIVLGTSPAF